MKQRKVILYIAMSLDGYIAGPDESLDFLKSVEQQEEDYGYSKFIEEVDTIIWGRKTYDKVKSFDVLLPYSDKDIFVLSALRTGKDKHVTYFNDVRNLIKELKSKAGKNIYCDGGGQLVREMLKYDLLDELRISVIPHLLGSGTLLFPDGRPEYKLHLIQAIPYESGLVQLWYDRIK
jgi:dihydrofolate reductase